MTTFRSIVVGLAAAFASTTALAQVDCNRTFGITGEAMPAEYAACSGPKTSIFNQPFAPTDTAFVNNLFAAGAAPPPTGIHSHVLNNLPGTLSFRGATNAQIFSMDFDAAATTLWAAVLGTTTPSNDRTIGTINQTTGAYTVVAALTGLLGSASEFASDLVIDPATDNSFLITNEGTPGAVTVRTYRVNRNTGALTLVGAASGQQSFLIDAAIDCSGQMFGHQFTSTTTPSNLVSINPTSGAISVIGSTGFAANFAQGMDFDADTGTLYMWHYFSTGGNSILRYGTVNLTTGALTPIFSTAVGQGIELEGAIRSTCSVLFANGFE